MKSTNQKWRTLIALLLVVSLLCAPIPAFAAEENDASDAAAVPALPAELALKIRTDYLAMLKTERPTDAQELGLNKVIIQSYYGSYHGVEVIMMTDPLAAAASSLTDKPVPLNIDGVIFVFDSETDMSRFYAYKGGTFYSIADAFEKGLLTRDDLLAVQELRHGEDSRFPWPPTFSDVPVHAWFCDAVRFVSENMLMNGMGGGIFAPNGTMSRAMLVTVLWRAEGCPEANGQPFTDVPAGKWYSQAVAWAARNLIVVGVGGGKFAPDSPVTREQLAEILYRMYGDTLSLPALDDTFADAADVHTWAQRAMRWAVHNKLIEGTVNANGRFLNPTATATRAQTAAILMRNRRPSQDSPIKDLNKGFRSQLTQVPTLDENSADAIAEFSVNLFRAARDSNKNSITSPLSVLYALAMTANGANGRTLSQLEQSFGMGISQTNDALLALRECLKDKKAVLNIANSIWVKDDFAVNADFLQKNADYLQAAAFQAPFDASTVAAMNDWIKQNTDGMIPKMLNTLPPETVLAFINAILFQSNWATPYPNTISCPFYQENGVVQTAEMLSSSENVYLHDDKATGFLKPFEGGKYAFAVVVPNKGVSLEDYIADMDGESLRELLKGEIYDAVHTQMPKFKAEFAVDLMKVFPRLGITDALTPGADFGGIADGLYISDALHKAVVDVNQFGVSAAAVTVVLASRTSIPKRTATVIADRPYLYMIVDTETDLPLFIGSNVTV